MLVPGVMSRGRATWVTARDPEWRDANVHIGRDIYTRGLTRPGTHLHNSHINVHTYALREHMHIPEERKSTKRQMSLLVKRVASC